MILARRAARYLTTIDAGATVLMANASYTFADDTIGALPAGTTLVNGGATVETGSNLSGKVLRVPPNTRNDLYLDLIPASTSLDVQLNMDIDWTASRRQGVLLFAAADCTTGYLVQWDDRTDDRIEIYRRTAAAPYTNTLIANTTGTVTATDNLWRVTCASVAGVTTIRVYSWNGSAWSLALEKTDSTHTSGGVAISVLNNVGNAELDNISTSFPQAIALTAPDAYQVFQRNGSDQADIAISGTYAGNPTAIEASWNGGAFTTIDASPSGFAFSGTLSSQSAGQGQLIVRFADAPTIRATVADVGVGDVYVVAGQSNAEGRATNAQTYSHSSLKATVFRQDDAWRDGNDPTDTSTANGSPWPLLATLLMADQGVPVAFITTAKGDTKLYTGTWTKPGAEFTDCVQTIQNSGVNGIKAILWHQGESDVNDAVTASQYETALSQMLDDLQTDTGFTAAPLVCATLGYKTTGGATRANLDAIRVGQLAAIANDADILAGPALYDVHLGDGGGDGVHFKTDAELLTLAQRWWRVLKYHFYGGAQGIAPAFALAARASTLLTVTFAGGVAPLTGATSVTGWRFTDSGVDIAVNSAAANGTNAIDLTLASAPTGTEAVSYGSFNDAAGASLLDSGTYPLPPTPLVDGAVSGWWALYGQTVVAAYQPKGAASLAASYVNLANPGVNDASAGVAPTLDASGWVFNGSTQYLTTGIVPASGYTMIVRFSDATANASFRAMIGSLSPTLQRFYIDPNRTSVGILYAAGGSVTVASGIDNGVLAIAGQSAYRNGVLDGAIPASTISAAAIYIGARNNNGVADVFRVCKIQAVAIYSTTLSDSEVAMITARMNLL